MESFENNGLIMGIYTKEDSITNLWLGASRVLKPSDFLSQFCNKLINRARGKKLIVDFSQLVIMNFSTIHFIITFIMKLNTEYIPTEIVYDKNKKMKGYKKYQEFLSKYIQTTGK